MNNLSTTIKNYKVLLIIVTIIVLGLSAWFYLTNTTESPLNDWGVSLGQTLLYGIVGFLGLKISKNLGKTSISKAVKYLGLASLSFSIASLIWFYNETIRGIEPYPSSADIFYTIMSPLLVISVAYLLTAYKTNLTKKSWFIAIIVFIVTTAIAVYFIGTPEASSGVSFWENFFNISYVMIDAILIGAVATSLAVVGGRITKGYLITIVGLVLLVAGDLTFAYRFTVAETYWGGDIADILLSLTAVAFSLAMISLAKGVRSNT